jgi:hypothetical protein
MGQGKPTLSTILSFNIDNGKSKYLHFQQKEIITVGYSLVFLVEDSL